MNPSSYSCKRNIRNVLKIALLSFKFYPFFPFFINLSITFLCVKNTIYSVSSNPYKALITAWNTSAVVGLEQLKIKTHTVENWKESLLQSNIFLLFMHSHIKTEKKILCALPALSIHYLDHWVFQYYGYLTQLLTELKK